MTRTVVLVDDQEDSRYVSRMLLAAEGWEVVGEADDGAAGVATALAQEPDVVLMDWRLPHQLQGDAASRLIHSTLPRTKIVAYSAYLDHQPEWADAWVDKISPQDLCGVLGGVTS